MWKLVLKSQSGDNIGEKGFWKSLDVYTTRPHILNKRVFGSHILQNWTLPEQFNIEQFLNHIQDFPIEEKIRSYLVNQNAEPLEFPNDSRIMLHNLLPRSTERFTEELQISIFDIPNKSLIVRPLSEGKIGYRITPNTAYKFELKEGQIFLYASLNASQQSLDWLSATVFPKIVKWAAAEKLAQEQPTTEMSILSLNLVKIEKYNSIRLNLKEKYAQKFVEIWPDDGTDPLKFIHEDIAISSYLISLWEAEMEDLHLAGKQSFVDLGCGNGLLTHILITEGYPGIGVDLRRRKLWDLLPLETSSNLKEMVITPSEHSLFPNYDWIIGNHSDELTPWIPVIAARTSYNMRVFLLPCCPFTFDGKFQRTNQGTSNYQSYLKFVADLCQTVGFKVQVDKLRIPSTKRTCFVCKSRIYVKENEAVMDEIRTNYIKDHSKNKSISEDSKNWSSNFKPREKVEKMQNCTQLGRDFLEAVVNDIASKLLAIGNESHQVPTVNGPKALFYGGTLSLAELASGLDDQVKLKMKDQNGGLQTLIRNHRHLFEITEGKVRITAPLSKNVGPVARKNKNKIEASLQSRPCWFFFNHPQECPFSDEECRFSHQKP